MMSNEKKIIIDEDWKSQVQAEKEAVAHPPEAADAPAGQPMQGGTDPPMPEASFELLLTMLATEALMAMGQMPHPATGQAHVHRNQAKYLIDTIEVLKEKTQGNLKTHEEQLIESILHQLRLVFVETANSSGG